MRKFAFLFAAVLPFACAPPAPVKLEESPGEISLKRQGKVVRTFRDTTGEECYDCPRYSRRADRGDGNIAVLFASYYEAYEYIAIDLRTGATAKMWGEPVPDSTGSWIVAANADLMAEFTLNGIQIFRARDSIRKVFELRMTDWEPYHPRWVSRDSIRLALQGLGSSFLTQSGALYTQDSAWLVRSGRVWKLKPDGRPVSSAEPL